MVVDFNGSMRTSRVVSIQYNQLATGRLRMTLDELRADALSATRWYASRFCMPAVRDNSFRARLEQRKRRVGQNDEVCVHLLGH